MNQEEKLQFYDSVQRLIETYEKRFDILATKVQDILDTSTDQFEEVRQAINTLSSPKPRHENDGFDFDAFTKKYVESRPFQEMIARKEQNIVDSFELRYWILSRVVIQTSYTFCYPFLQKVVLTGNEWRTSPLLL